MTRLDRYLRYARILAGHAHPFLLVTSRLLRAAGISDRITMQFPRFQLRLYPTTISESYFMNPGDRSGDHEFLERYLRPGDAVVDVGANIGALAVHSAVLVGAEGRVVAFEAHPRTHGFLLGNVALNRLANVTAHQVALGSSEGEIAFSDLKDDDVNGVDRGGPVKVRLTTLDTVLASTPGPIAVLKVDVEGYEREVFLGARETLRRTECVYFESWDALSARYGYGTTEVLAVLRDAGLTTCRLGPDRIEEVEDGYRSERLENLVAVRDAHAFEARWTGAPVVPEELRWPRVA